MKLLNHSPFIIKMMNKYFRKDVYLSKTEWEYINKKPKGYIRKLIVADMGRNNERRGKRT